MHQSAPVRRSFRTATQLGALAVAVALSIPVAGANAAPAGHVGPTTLPGELVVNGGAETGDSTGWTGDIAARTYGNGSYPTALVLPLPGTPIPDPGTRFFSGMGAVSQAHQDIDLSPAATAIDNGVAMVDVSAYIGGFQNQEDQAKVTYEFYDASNALVRTVVLAAATATDRASESGFLHRSDSLTLDPGVRSVRVLVDAVRQIAPANDGYVDKISLQMFVPVATGVDDAPTTVQDQPVTFNPTDNDTAGSGTMDPTSVRLLDGGTPVTTLTNADGTYVVDTTTGEVTFTPAAGFTGTATPVDYLANDVNGGPLQATIIINVGPLAGVSMVDGPVALGVLGGTVLLGVVVAARRRRVGSL